MIRKIALLTLALLFSLTLYAQSIPPLPKLPLDTYTAAIREQIEAAYQAAIHDPDGAESNGHLGMVLYAYEQYEFAAPCFERARSFGPADKRWAYYLGRSQANLHKFEQAVAFLQEVLRFDADYLPARLKLGECLLEAGKQEESQKIYQAVLDEHPDEASAHYGLGRICAIRRDLSPAIEHLRKACELFPGFGAAHFALARAYRDAGETAKAQEELALYQKNKLGWPTTPDPLLSEALDLKTGPTAHLRKGIELAEAGQLKAAADEHELALEADPKLVQAHIHLIRLYEMLGRPERADEHYRAAVALDPNLSDTYYNYGVLLTQQKRYSEAMEAYRRTLELDPSHAEANNNYAYLLMTSGKLEDATKYYKAAIVSKPGHRGAHFNLGRILVQQGKYQDAIDHFLQTLTPDDEETPRCMYALAAAYARAGDRENALKYTKEARQQAAALGQKELLDSIDRDLRLLEPGSNPP